MCGGGGMCVCVRGCIVLQDVHFQLHYHSHPRPILFELNQFQRRFDRLEIFYCLL